MGEVVNGSARFLALAGLGLGLALAGCADAEKKAAKAAEKAASEVRQAAELHAEYAALAGADRMHRFDAGVTVRGAVGERVDHGVEGGGVAVRLPVGDGAAVVLRFADPAAAAAAGATAVGELATARCRIDAEVDDVLFLTDCAAVPAAD
jgi:hypothetical protein